MFEPSLPWWVIHSSEILEMLRRAHEGEDPNTLLAEWYANSEVESIDYRDDDD